MTKRNIVLTGFMGTGKSTVGKRAAGALGYDFVDTDQLIEERAGRTVAEIFRDEGEAAFRAMESAVAEELSLREGLVIATGGRLMLDPGNAALLEATGLVFCLTASAEEIFARVSADGPELRPLLAVDNPMDRIRALLAERKEGYGRFPQLSTTGKTPDQLADAIVRRLRADAGAGEAGDEMERKGRGA